MSLFLFDLDGTLIDSCNDLMEAGNLLRVKYGKEMLSRPVIQSYIGNGMRNLVTRLLPEIADDLEATETAFAQMKEIYRGCMLHTTRLYPGVAETLPVLRKRHSLAVVTNKTSPMANALLESLGVASQFHTIIGGDDVSRLKPDPEPLQLAANRTGESLADAWMCGDQWTDLQAAANAGSHACFCAWGYGSMTGYHADAVLQQFSELPSLVP
ncbi:MAG: HAD-IA family hydrolase [Victivallales bacterium]|nr:HAD-IA family hydrolase [Victivallales bacterium]